MLSRFLFAALFAALSVWSQASYTFSDGGKPASYQLAETEVFDTRSATVQSRTAAEMKRTRTSRANRANVAPVFYDLRDLPSPDRLAALSATERNQRRGTARRAMTAKLLVRMDEGRWSELAATSPTVHEKSLLSGWMLVTYADAFAALDAADWLTKNGKWEFTPVFSRQFSTKQALVREVNDPLYPQQWHLADSASTPNLNMKNSWDFFTGKGINMAIVDDGLEIAHEDLAPNAYPLDSGYHYNFNDGNAADPTPTKASQSHGTKCAGLAGAAGFNGIGVTGVAPEVRLMGLRILGGDTADDASARALAWQPAGLITHVSSNSWGPADDGKSAGRVGALTLSGLEAGTSINRNGLGTVYAISCGNGRGSADDASYDELSGSRFGIAVAAVNREGGQSSFSESGMTVAISALGGEFQPPAVLWTTNNSGDEAFALKAADFPSTVAPINYTDAMNGTSAAAPQVSGAAALMLQANPKLGYRDVKEILMKSALRDSLKGGDPFFTNKGGFTFSRSFGAGLLNVSGALILALDWTNLGPMVTSEAATDGGAIPSAAPGLVKTFVPALNLRTEHVELTVNVKHPKRGELGFVITSPSGTRTYAEVRPNDDNADFADYTFTTPHFWGESSAGSWQLTILDVADNDQNGQLVSAKLKVYGTAK